MADIFISYSSDDRARVAPIVAGLEASGLSVWWDQHLTLQDDFAEAINRELDHAGVVIAVWTASSAASEFARAEALRARQRGKLLQVVLDAVDVPVPFNAAQHADLRHWSGDRSDPNFMELIRGVTGVPQSDDAVVHLSAMIADLGADAVWRADLPGALEHARAVIEWGFHRSARAREWSAGGFPLSQFQKACAVRNIAYVDHGFSDITQFSRFVCADMPYRVVERADGSAAIQRARAVHGTELPALRLHSPEYYRVILYRRPQRIHPFTARDADRIFRALAAEPGSWYGPTIHTRLRAAVSADLHGSSIDGVLYTLRSCGLVQYRPFVQGPLIGEYTVDRAFDPAAAMRAILQTAQAKITATLGACAPKVLDETFGVDQRAMA